MLRKKFLPTTVKDMDNKIYEMNDSISSRFKTVTF
jgi:hypothetical protein